MAGRKRKVEGELREPICFSVSPACKRMAADLRSKGLKVGELVELFIAHSWAAVFGGDLDYKFTPGEDAVEVEVILKSEIK